LHRSKAIAPLRWRWLGTAEAPPPMNHGGPWPPSAEFLPWHTSVWLSTFRAVNLRRGEPEKHPGNLMSIMSIGSRGRKNLRLLQRTDRDRQIDDDSIQVRWEALSFPLRQTAQDLVDAHRRRWRDRRKPHRVRHATGGTDEGYDVELVVLRRRVVK